MCVVLFRSSSVPQAPAGSAVSVLMQTHLAVLGDLARADALHSMEELSLGHGACLRHHLLLAAGHMRKLESRLRSPSAFCL